MRTWKISVLFALAGHKQNRKTCATRKFNVRTKRGRPNQIEAMSKYDLKTLVKKKAKQAAFSRLVAIKETKTKMDNISYEHSFNCQPYIHTLTRAQSSLLLALRTRTVRGIRSDYGDMFPDKQCPLPGCSEPDSLPHTLACQVLVGTDR